MRSRKSRGVMRSGKSRGVMSNEKPEIKRRNE
jgi:hypothetical protein